LSVSERGIVPIEGSPEDRAIRFIRMPRMVALKCRSLNDTDRG